MSDVETKPERPASTETAGNIELSEKGRGADGKPISLDRRLFMRFMAYANCSAALRGSLQEKLAATESQVVLYEDVNDPQGLGVLAFCENPAYLIDHVHPLLTSDDMQNARLKPEFTMFGRTYAIGYEPDLEEVLIHRPIRKVCDRSTPWAVYYPLRRSGEFERQPREEQRKMLMEHGGIGQAYGKAGLATDIRLAGHGLNTEDNDFIVGLLGKELFPLSALVQHMRRTRQTSEFIERMGPFFVGRAIWQPELSPGAPLQ